MKYTKAYDIEEKAKEIVARLELKHIDIDNIACIRSFGTKSRRTIARCHALGKVMQKAMDRKSFYVLEFLSERFDKLNEEDKIKTIIHELLHIPKSFGGGFKHHDFVREKRVKMMYDKFMKSCSSVGNKNI